MIITPSCFTQLDHFLPSLVMCPVHVLPSILGTYLRYLSRASSFLNLCNGLQVVSPRLHPTSSSRSFLSVPSNVPQSHTPTILDPQLCQTQMVSVQVYLEIVHHCAEYRVAIATHITWVPACAFIKLLAILAHIQLCECSRVLSI